MFRNTTLPPPVPNNSIESLLPPLSHVTIPDISESPPPTYAQAIGISTESNPNSLSIHDFGIPACNFEERQEHNINIHYDPTNPHPIFPFNINRAYHVPSSTKPHFADQLPLGFPDDEWERVWNDREQPIDQYLREVQFLHDASIVPWTNEYDYNGVPYRLTIDHQRSFIGLPNFTHGTTISFRNSNGRNHRYIIDHCLYQDDLNAYLKVICFDSTQRRYDVCSYRPPLILVIPLSHCDVRVHPNVIPKPSTRPSRNYTRVEQEMIEGILRGYHSQSSPSFWQRLFRR